MAKNMKALLPPLILLATSCGWGVLHGSHDEPVDNDGLAGQAVSAGRGVRFSDPVAVRAVVAAFRRDAAAIWETDENGRAYDVRFDVTELRVESPPEHAGCTFTIEHYRSPRKDSPWTQEGMSMGLTVERSLLYLEPGVFRITLPSEIEVRE